MVVINSSQIVSCVNDLCVLPEAKALVCERIGKKRDMTENRLTNSSSVIELPFVLMAAVMDGDLRCKFNVLKELYWNFIYPHILRHISTTKKS